MADMDFPQVVIKSPAEQKVEARYGQDITEVLRNLYHGTERLTQDQMAARLGVSRSTVVEWMQKHGIPTGYNRSQVA